MLKQLSSEHLNQLSVQAFNTPKLFTWALGQRGNELSSYPVDEVMPLLERGRLAVIAGAEGSGKTTWSIEMARQNAIKGATDGYTVGYLSLEVDPLRIASRYAERCICLEKKDKMYGFSEPLLSEKKEIYTKALHEFASAGIYMVPSVEQPHTLDYIQSICSDPAGPSLLLIDNLAEITCGDKPMAEYDRYDLVIRSLLDLCRNTDTSIVLLHHLAKPKNGEKQNINSIKGNNIVITKADIVISIDKYKMPNPNWACSGVDKNDKLVTDRVRAAFMGYAPKIEVRSVEVHKDRDWDDRGVKGYLNLKDGIIQCASKMELMEACPLSLTDRKRYEAALADYHLINPNDAEINL